MPVLVVQGVEPMIFFKNDDQNCVCIADPHAHTARIVRSPARAHAQDKKNETECRVLGLGR